MINEVCSQKLRSLDLFVSDNMSQKNVCVSPLIFQTEISMDSSFSLSYKDSFLGKQTITILYYIIINILLLLLCTLVPRYCRLVPRGTKVHDFRKRVKE
jgi:hypothetical protein